MIIFRAKQKFTFTFGGNFIFFHGHFFFYVHKAENFEKFHGCLFFSGKKKMSKPSRNRQKLKRKTSLEKCSSVEGNYSSFLFGLTLLTPVFFVTSYLLKQIQSDLSERKKNHEYWWWCSLPNECASTYTWNTQSCTCTYTDIQTSRLRTTIAK